MNKKTELAQWLLKRMRDKASEVKIARAMDEVRACYERPIGSAS